MDAAWKQMMETNINEYISRVDFRNPDFSVNALKNELGAILGIKPSVKLKWKTTEKVNELLKQAGAKNYTETIEKVEQITITFVDADNTPVELKFIV